MGIAHSQASQYVKEMQKWEQRPVMIGDTMIMPLPVSEGGRMGMPFQPYPKMLYRAERADGGPKISGQLIVHSAQEEAAEVARGWCDGQEVAIAAIKAQDKEWATLAAERAYHERSMSDRARAEAAAVEEASSVHVPVIPETPIKRRGRPKKTEIA